MRKTTITVAAFMAVAAASYAAVTPPNAGYEFTIAKGKKEASQTFSLKEGTYSISIKESKGSIKVDDKDYLAGNILTVEAAKDVKITVMFDAKDQDEMFTLTIVPTTEAWTKWLADQQTIITNLMSEASNLGKGDGTATYMKPEDKIIEAGWRTDLISRISDIQKAKNACGIEEYNEWVDKNSVNSLSGLGQLKSDVNDKTANHNAYQNAITNFKKQKDGGDLDYSELTKEYNGSAANGLFIDTYETLIKEIDGVEANAWDVYIAGNAAANYEAQKLATLISGLNGRIVNLTTAIKDGSGQYANWSAVDDAVNSAIASYNEQFNNLYSQLAASTLQEGYGKDIYNDYYEDAVKELNAILAKIYAVKNANDAAKKAYDAAAPDKKPAINGLKYYNSDAGWTGANAAWESDDFAASLAAVYAKYVTTGTEEVVPAGEKGTTGKKTLRGAYRAHIATIVSLRSSLSVFNTAKVDKGTDKDGNVISTYFSGKVSALENAINNLETKVKDANRNHKKNQTIVDFDIEASGKTKIDEAKTFLDTQKAEYDEYAKTRNIINTLENNTFNAAKTFVKGKEYKDFKAEDRFSKKHIDTAISDFKKAARDNYMVEGGKGLAATYYSDACQKKNADIVKKINTWKDDAESAFNSYTAISKAIDAYDLEIKGLKNATGVTVIESWASVVLNENVTVGGKIEATSVTYGAKKAAADLVVATAQNKLNDAMAVAKEKETEFKTALSAAYDAAFPKTEPTVSDKTAEICSLKVKYATDAPVWQNNTSYQAAIDAKKESQSMKNASQAAVDAIAIKGYTAADYGTKAAETLNAEITRIKGLLTTIQDLIDAVELPKSPNDEKTQQVAATAIAQINEIKVELATVDAAINTLVKITAPAANTNFTYVKGAIDEITDNINGRKADQEVTKIAGIAERLDLETNETIPEAFTSAIKDLNGKADKLLEDLHAAPVVADVLEDKPADGEKPAFTGLKTRCKDLLKTVIDYQTKAENEAKNNKNYDAWVAFLNNPDGTDPATTAQGIITASKIAIDNAHVGSTTAGESYFQNLIGDASAGKQKEFDEIKTAVDDLYDNKLAAPNNAFTDPDNNLTDAKLTENKNKVLTILKAVKTYPSLAKTNEAAYTAQGTEYAKVLGEYNKLRLEISAAKPSGDKFTASYNKALEELTAINDALATYNTNKESEYAKGASDAFDAEPALYKINAINTKITALEEKWTGDESKEGSYLKAVADDNAARYTDFLSALDELKVAYYGKTVGTDHIDGAIDIVSKLSSLSYADQVEPEEYKKLVEGPDGLYQYAEKIADLASRASTNKDATKAPAFRDVDRTFKEEATAMKNIVNSKKNEYAALVNGIAVSTYTDPEKPKMREIVAQLLDDARTALKDTKLAADNDEADILLDAVKSPSLGKGAVYIYNEAEQAYNEKGTPDADFAYRLDKEFIPGFKEIIETLIDKAKDKAASDAWDALRAKVNTTEDAKAMAYFMWNEDYATVKDMSSFVQGAAPKDFAFNEIEYNNTFDGYAKAKLDYDAAVKSGEID